MPTYPQGELRLVDQGFFLLRIASSFRRRARYTQSVAAMRILGLLLVFVLVVGIGSVIFLAQRFGSSKADVGVGDMRTRTVR